MKKRWSYFLMIMLSLPFLWFVQVVSAASPTVATTTTGSAVLLPGSANFAWSFNYPTGIVTGDLIVVEITALTASSSFYFDGDWTQISTRRAVTFSTVSAYRNATGEEPNSQVSVSFNVAPTAVRYIAYRINKGTHSGIVYGVVSATGTSVNPDPPALTPGVGTQDYLWLAWESHSSTATCSAAPASYGTLLTVTGTSPGICSAQRAVLAATTENPGTFTISASTLWDAQTLGIVGRTWSINYNGFNSLVKTTAESAGANCGNGGIKVESGLDDGLPSGTARDGILQAGEVDSTIYVCNGAPGATGAAGFNSLILVASEAQGANCANPGGGISVKVGLDNGDGGGTARDGILQAGEVDAGPFYVCNGATGATGAQGIQGIQGPAGADGFNSLVKLTTESAGVNCANGGIKVESGLDDGVPSGTARNGILEVGEVDFTRYVCNGTNGTNGANGHQALVAMVSEPPGSNCATGGVKITSGTDTNDDGILQAGEITSTNYACNGANGTNGTNGSQGPPGQDARAWILFSVFASMSIMIVAISVFGGRKIK